MIHFTLSRGYVFIPRCKFELELSRRYLFVSQHAYLFDLLFFYSCFYLSVATHFSSLSPFPLGIWVMFYLGLARIWRCYKPGDHRRLC